MMDSVPVSATGPMTPSQQQQQQQQQKKGVSFEFSTSDLEPTFEPQTRARSNTWPLPRPEEYVEGNAPVVKEGVEGGTPPHQTQLTQGGLLPVKKNSSRRNAWGNLSYADLITQAITSAPDQRLTLSQIYDWMVTNVAYFKDKGDNNSSAGWKNSIRHNLSLHNRFIRTQNEGTGKSSWWMINRDAKPGKSARRRATTMESTSMEKRRGRSKKVVEALRNGMSLPEPTPSSPNSREGEGHDVYSDSPLPPTAGPTYLTDCRTRSSSNASSCSRLSPIPSGPGLPEPEWTPTPYPYSPEQQLADSILAGNLAETMKLDAYQIYQTSPPSHQQQQQQQQQPPPPPYFPEYPSRNNGLRTPSSFGMPTPQSVSQQRCSNHGLQPCACQMSPASGMSPSYQQSEPSPTTLGTNQQTLQYMIQTQQRQQQQQQQQQQSQHQQPHQSAQTGPAGPSPPNTPTPGSVTPSTMMGQLMDVLNPALLDDLNINIEAMHGGFDCNVEEVIKHELSMGGTLDFNFHQGVHVSDGNVGPNGAVSQNAGVVVGTTTGNAPPGVYVSTNAATPAAPPSWVH